MTVNDWMINLGQGYLCLQKVTLDSLGHLDWISGEISLLNEWSGIGIGCPGKWWSHHAWRCSKNM